MMPQPEVDTLCLELTNHCNFDCDFCANHLMTRQKGYMELSLVKRLISEAAEKNFCNKIALNVLGEPFLHEDLFEILAFAQNRSQKVLLITNGSFLRGEIACRILEAPPDLLVISFHANNLNAFKHRRSPIPYSEYKKMILDFIELKYQMKSNMPIEVDCLSTFYMPHDRFRIINTVDEFQEFEKDWLDFARLLKKKYSLKYKPPRALLPGVNPLVEGLSLRPNMTHFYWGNTLRPAGTKVMPTSQFCCPEPCCQCNILWNGDLIPCNFDYNGELAYANVQHQSLMEAFHSAAGQQYRDQFTRGGKIPTKCLECLGTIKNADGTDYEPLKKGCGPLDLGNFRIAFGLMRKRFVWFRVRAAIRTLWRKIRGSKDESS
jgi:pyruvate-formate lyase-activating enzyme